MSRIQHTLVWIDARDAIIVGHRHDEIVIERLASDVPDHQRSTSHVHHDPNTPSSHDGTATHGADDPRRLEHLARFRQLVADRLPVADDLTILGPGPVREHLERELLEADRHHRRARTIVSVPAERMTDRQLIARLSREAGVEPRRRTVGAYRWSGRLTTSHSGRREVLPLRVDG